MSDQSGQFVGAGWGDSVSNDPNQRAAAGDEPVPAQAYDKTDEPWAKSTMNTFAKGDAKLKDES